MSNRRTVLAGLVIAAAFLPAQSHSAPRRSTAVAPAIAAALIGVGVTVVGGTITWVNEQSDDVRANGAAVATSSDFGRCGAGVEARSCTDGGFVYATCTAEVDNNCGLAWAIPWADEPFIGSNTLEPNSGAFASGALHFPNDDHDAEGIAAVHIDETSLAERSVGLLATGSSPPGTVQAYLDVQSLRIETRKDSLRSSEWDIAYVANGSAVFTSAGTIDKNGNTSITGDLSPGLFSSNLQGDRWVLELSSPFHMAVDLGVLANPGDTMEVTMDIDATMTARDHFGGSGGGVPSRAPALPSWASVTLVVLLGAAAAAVARRF